MSNVKKTSGSGEGNQNGVKFSHLLRKVGDFVELAFDDNYPDFENWMEKSLTQQLEAAEAARGDGDETMQE